MNEEELDKIIKMTIKTLESNGYSLSKYESVEVFTKDNYNLILSFSNFYNPSMIFRVFVLKENDKYYVIANNNKYELKEVDKNE